MDKGGVMANQSLPAKSARHLSIGEMARLNGVSEKALRLYHRKGLVVPAFVDDETGYRFYAIGQSVTIDVVRHMQQMGFSLGEIADVLERDDPAYYRQTVANKAGLLENEIARLAQAKRLAEHYLDSFDIMLDHPPFGQVTIEKFEPKRIMRLGIHNPRITEPTIKGDELLPEWELHLRGVRAELERRGLPFTTLHHVGTITSHESLLAGHFAIEDTFIFLNRSMGEVFDEHGEDIPGGYYASLYYDSLVDARGEYSTAQHMGPLMSWANERGLKLEGDCFGLDLADTPHFNRPRDMMCKVCIRIADGQDLSGLVN